MTGSRKREGRWRGKREWLRLSRSNNVLRKQPINLLLWHLQTWHATNSLLPSNVPHILFICLFITICSSGLAHLAGREKNVTFPLVVMAKNQTVLWLCQTCRWWGRIRDWKVNALQLPNVLWWAHAICGSCFRLTAIDEVGSSGVLRHGLTVS